MTQETYNSWTNYVTWRVNLEMFDGTDFASDNDLDRYDLGEVLREYALDVLDTQGSGLALDYARAFVNDVNWFEIARHQIEAYRPQEVEA
jgi:hypothetical protein